MKSKPKFFIYYFLGIFFIMGCERKMDPTNRFINDFLAQNGKQFYKSEMKRTKVDYLPSSQKLVYSFWKKSVYEKNGSLFLHLYPSNLDDLPQKRKQYGFLNIKLGQEDIQQIDSVHFYITKDLSSYGDIERLVTGQYINNKRTWAVDEKLDFDKIDNYLKKNKTNAISDKSELGIAQRLLNDNALFLNEDDDTDTKYYIGPKRNILYLSTDSDVLFFEGRFEILFLNKEQEKDKKLKTKKLNKFNTYCLGPDSWIASTKIPLGTDTICLLNFENGVKRRLFCLKLD